MSEKRILLIDDNEEMMEDLAGIIRTEIEECDVAFSRDAQEAVRAAENEEADIIVLDTAVHWTDKPSKLEGPDNISSLHENGVGALIEIKKKNPEQRVIITTTAVRQEVEDYCLSHGAKAVLTKVFKVEELLNLLKTLGKQQ